ncbi:MAG TPA: NAD(P)/FAD-dependent oxidoreductase [Candidatus Limnocylindria bacterium]|nr:NAD(P)/FAD-dependent oxidoreductase [Candidatus Limnocylindria bacterium]
MSNPPQSPHHVVIVGGGFGGLHAARALGKSGRRVTLVDKRNFQLFQPLLYQVATGSLTTGDIAIPQRVVLRKYPNIHCYATTAYDVDPARKVLLHEFGELPYDTLIVATGVKHHYFGRDEWRAFAPGLKTVEHAIEIRRRIFNAFELAELETDEAARRDLMSFVIVGGGPTGVELAGAIGELANRTMVDDFRAIDPRKAKILLVEGAPEILPLFPPKLRAAARRHLEELGVEVQTRTLVEDVSEDGVRTRSGDTVASVRAKTVLWAAGVRASQFGEVIAERTGVGLDRSGRVAVRADCSVTGHDDVFVIGDLARMTDAAGRDVPGLAPAAIQQGEYVAKVIRARLAGKAAPAPFRYKDLGTMAVIGMNRAVGDLRFMQVTGAFAWLMWAFVHILALIDGAQRLRVFVLWTWKYFTRKIGDRLVTGLPSRSLEHASAAMDADGV